MFILLIRNQIFVDSQAAERRGVFESELWQETPLQGRQNNWEASLQSRGWRAAEFGTFCLSRVCRLFHPPVVAVWSLAVVRCPLRWSPRRCLWASEWAGYDTTFVLRLLDTGNCVGRRWIKALVLTGSEKQNFFAGGFKHMANFHFVFDFFQICVWIMYLSKFLLHGCSNQLQDQWVNLKCMKGKQAAWCRSLEPTGKLRASSEHFAFATVTALGCASPSHVFGYMCHKDDAELLP